MYILITYISQIFYKFSKKVASEKIYFREFINYPQVSKNNTGLEKVRCVWKILVQVNI